MNLAEAGNAPSWAPIIPWHMQPLPPFLFLPLFSAPHALPPIGPPRRCPAPADQKRLQQPLYRHPWEDVLYTS